MCHSDTYRTLFNLNYFLLLKRYVFDTDDTPYTTMSTAYTTLDYECTNEKKGSGMVLVPRKCGVYE